MAEYSEEKDKITERELTPELRERITLSFSHIRNNDMHITQGERDDWNAAANMPNATKYIAGKMSSADKTKLDTIEDNANNYIHPKSGVEYGSYTQVKVDENGHVIEGSNPSKLNITVTNAELLNGLEPKEYAKVLNTVLTGVPQCPTATGTNKFQIVNVNYLEKTLSAFRESLLAELKK